MELGGVAGHRGARVVDDGAEVAEDAERVGGALRGDVPDGRAVAVGLERVDVRLGLGGLRALLGDDEDVGSGPLGDRVGEVLALGALAVLAASSAPVVAVVGTARPLAGEPDLDAVAGAGALTLARYSSK